MPSCFSTIDSFVRLNPSISRRRGLCAPYGAMSRRITRQIIDAATAQIISGTLTQDDAAVRPNFGFAHQLI